MLERWVENDETPGQITATAVSGLDPVRTRPWCPYRQLKYIGRANGHATFFVSGARLVRCAPPGSLVLQRPNGK
jgi:hypothetical protein